MAGDLYYDNVAILLHLDGSEGSTTVTDNSPSPKTVTAIGDAHISTTQSKFGGSSAYFDGVGDRLKSSHATAFDAAGDFTVEAWVYPSAVSGITDILGGSSSLYTYIGINAGHIYTKIGGATGQSGGTISAAAWTHIAACRSGNTVKFFINGVQDGSFTTSNAFNASYINVGAQADTSNHYTGYVDDLRLTIGVARYTANFPAPVSPFPDGPALISSLCTISIAGQLPSISVGAQLSPLQKAVAIVGQAAFFSGETFRGSPSMGNTAILGGTPAGIDAGFASDAIQRVMFLDGSPAGYAAGWVDTPSQANITLEGQHPNQSQYVFRGTPLIGGVVLLGGQASVSLGFSASAMLRTLAIAGQLPDFVNRILYPVTPQATRTLYRCYLTGAADALPDLEIKIESFQTRYGVSPLRAYLSAVVNGVDTYIDAINARPNGSLRVDREYHYLDGSVDTFVMIVVPFDTVDLYQGARAGATGTLSGFENMTPITPQNIQLASPTYYNLSGGKLRYRCALDPRLRPLDTALINGDTFVVGSIVHIVDARTTTMEIGEA